MAISANALAVKNENKKIEAVKETFVISLLQQTDFDLDKIANIADVSIEFVKTVKQRLSDKK